MSKDDSYERQRQDDRNNDSLRDYREAAHRRQQFISRMTRSIKNNPDAIRAIYGDEPASHPQQSNGSQIPAKHPYLTVTNLRFFTVFVPGFIPDVLNRQYKFIFDQESTSCIYVQIDLKNKLYGVMNGRYFIETKFFDSSGAFWASQADNVDILLGWDTAYHIPGIETRFGFFKKGLHFVDIFIDGIKCSNSTFLVE